MPASRHRVLSKCDRALVAYIISQGAGTAADTLPAKRSGLKPTGSTIVWSQRSTEEPAFSGNYVVSVAIVRRENALTEPTDVDETKEAASDEAWGDVCDCFKLGVEESSEVLAEAITAAARASTNARDADLADFTVQGVVDKGCEQGVEEDTGLWSDTLNLEVTCCPANVS